MSNEGDWVFDPFLGTGTTIIAAIRHKRKAAGAEIVSKYVKLALDRIGQEITGTLRTRPMNRPVYDPIESGNSLALGPRSTSQKNDQLVLLDKPVKKQGYVAR
jgi:adenine-specific DNA-methyltransferase